MVPFNSLLNLQPSRFAVWIKFYLCSGVNVWRGWHWFFPTSRIPAAGYSLFPQMLFVQRGSLGSWSEDAAGEPHPFPGVEGVTPGRGEGRSFSLFRSI